MKKSKVDFLIKIENVKQFETADNIITYYGDFIKTYETSKDVSILVCR